MKDNPYEPPNLEAPVQEPTGAPSLTLTQFGNPFASVVILSYLLPPLGYRPTETDTIINAILFTIGGYLAYSSIRSGHWIPRLFGALVLTPYVIFVLMVTHHAYQNWSDLTEYWTG